MRILFVKAAPSVADSSAEVGHLPIREKLRRVLELHVKDATTRDDKERAEREIANFVGDGACE